MGGSGVEAEYAKGNKHGCVLKRMNDRQKVKEAIVPGFTPASRLGCSILFPTWLSVSYWTDGESNSSASTEDISSVLGFI